MTELTGKKINSTYKQLLKNALEEDKERASIYFKPKIGYV